MREYRTAAIVHLGRLKRNTERVLKILSPGTELMATVKGDAYGHGMEECIKLFESMGIRSYACANAEEALQIRSLGVKDKEILILGDNLEKYYPALIENSITQTVFSLEIAKELNKKALELGKVLPVNIKIDTGMSRIGFPAGKACLSDIIEISKMKGLKITGAFTHFMCADDLESDLTEIQFKRFTDTISMLRENGVDIPMIHAANSPTTLLRPDMHLDRVRVGDAIFGLAPIADEDWIASGFEDVMTWESYVSFVKTVPAGTFVGYGATYQTNKETTIATIPVGFYDGYSRALANKGSVYINGREAPVIGKVCMNQFMVDVSGLDVKRGDNVTLLGEGMSILRMANLLDKNVDEIVCGISKDVPKIYVND